MTKRGEGVIESGEGDGVRVGRVRERGGERVGCEKEREGVRVERV